MPAVDHHRDLRDGSRPTHGAQTIDLQLTLMAHVPKVNLNVPKLWRGKDLQAAEVFIMMRVEHIMAMHAQFRFSGRDPRGTVAQCRVGGNGRPPECGAEPLSEGPRLGSRGLTAMLETEKGGRHVERQSLALLIAVADAERACQLLRGRNGVLKVEVGPSLPQDLHKATAYRALGVPRDRPSLDVGQTPEAPAFALMRSRAPPLGESPASVLNCIKQDLLYRDLVAVERRVHEARTSVGLQMRAGPGELI